MGNEIISFEEIFRAIKKRIKFIILFVLVVNFANILVNLYVLKPVYKSQAKIFIGKQATEAEEDIYSNTDVVMYKSLLDTYAEVIYSSKVIGTAIEETGLDLSGTTVVNNLTVEPKENTQIIDLSYTSENPEETKEVLDEILEQTISVSKELIPNGLISIISEPVTPVNPISPNKVNNIIIGLIISTLLGVTISVAKEIMTGTIESEEDVEAIDGLTVIGVLPGYTSRIEKKEIKARRKSNVVSKEGAI